MQICFYDKWKNMKKHYFIIADALFAFRNLHLLLFATKKLFGADYLRICATTFSPFEEWTFFVFSILRKTTKKPQQNKVVSSRCERDLTKVNCLRHFIHNNAWRVCRRVSLTSVTNGTKSTEGISRLLGNKRRYPILDRSLAILLLEYFHDFI